MKHLEDRIFRDLAFETEREAPPANFLAFPEIPGGRYTRQDFFDLEMRHVFQTSWVMAGLEAELPRRGSFKRFDKIVGAPMLLVRGRDDRVRAFFNTCRHRGAPLVHEQSGRCNVLRCQYHSWAYDFDGALVQVPDERDFVDLDKSKRGLIEASCEVFGGMIFVNLDRQARPLHDHLGVLAEEWAPILDQKPRYDYYWSRVIDCNWKCALDAFQEVYHINTLHPATVGATLDHRAATMGLLPDGNSRMCVRYTGADIANPPAGGWPAGEMFRRTSVAHTFWPGLNVPWSPDGGKVMLFWPRGPGQCEIEIYGLGPDWGEGPLPPERVTANERFDGILEEDVSNLSAIQRSLNSGAFTGMMLNYQERRLYWSHEEVDRRIGPDRVPPGLAVRQLLSPYVEAVEPPAAE